MTNPFCYKARRQHYKKAIKRKDTTPILCPLCEQMFYGPGPLFKHLKQCFEVPEDVRGDFPWTINVRCWCGARVMRLHFEKYLVKHLRESVPPKLLANGSNAELLMAHYHDTMNGVGE